jgi:hypothetical protein
VSCPTDTLHDPPAGFSVGQGAPTSHSGHYGEEAQRPPGATLPGALWVSSRDAAQRERYFVGYDTSTAAMRRRLCPLCFISGHDAFVRPGTTQRGPTKKADATAHQWTMD